MGCPRRLLSTAAVALLLTGCTSTVRGEASPGDGATPAPAPAPADPAGPGPAGELLATVPLAGSVTAGYQPDAIASDGAGGAYVVLSGSDPFGVELVHVAADGSGGLAPDAPAVRVPQAISVAGMHLLPDGRLALFGAIEDEGGTRQVAVLPVDPATGTGPPTVTPVISESELSDTPFDVLSPDGSILYVLTTGGYAGTHHLLAVEAASGQLLDDVIVSRPRANGGNPAALAVTQDGGLVAAFEGSVTGGGLLTVLQRYGTDLEPAGEAVVLGEPADEGFRALTVTGDGTALALVGLHDVTVYAVPAAATAPEVLATIDGGGPQLISDAVADPDGAWVTVAHDEAVISADLTTGAQGSAVPICENGLGVDVLVPGVDGTTLLLGRCDTTTPEEPHVWVLGPPQ